ncbi:lysozyme-like [Achroia grisella]|uniref:lysozyme-like n=1 Tax=Achroia grisella TaxID=688607 RepID=UPI0027D260DD|nr:lysozyme-like [Achroia grisella]
MKVYILTLLIASSVFQCDSVKFTRCKLVRELLKIKSIDKTFLGNWVCLIEKESQRDTAAYRESGSRKYYGLYQIPQVWCKNGKRGGKCNIACEALLDDDIRDDTECAVRIYEMEGFKYWSQWMQRCKNDNFITSEIYKCPDLSSPRLSSEKDLEEKLKLKRQQEQMRNHSDLRTYYGLNWFF